MSNAYHFSTTEVDAIWQQLCTELQTQLSPAVFGTWIVSNPLREVIIDENVTTARFSCLTAFHASTIKKTLSAQIKTSLDAMLGKDTTLDFVVGNPTAAAPPLPPVQVASVETPSDPESAPTQLNQPLEPSVPSAANHLDESATPTTSPAASSTPLADLVARHNPGTPQATMVLPGVSTPAGSSHALSTPAKPAPPLPPVARRLAQGFSPRVDDLFSPQTMQSVAMDRALTTARIVGLRPDYTFDKFAVSTTNEMAHAAATAVSNRPGVAYNPLFLYGGVGVGKTHLMHAIGNNILKNNPDTRIIYCTGEEFTNDIVNAIQMKKAIRFKEKYRTANVLLLDDVQFLAGKNAVQEEFFHTFNALIKQASQIVMTSDRSPHEITLLEDRLRSRFEAGLMIDIQQPSFELRTAILLIKASAHNISIPMDLAQLIASKVDSARKIEGMITSIKSAVELQRRPISQELIETILHSETDQARPTLRVTPNDVLRAVANHYHVKQNAIKGQQRVADLVKARHVAMYLLKEDLHLSLSEIGKWFSNRDHTSALHGIKKINLELINDELLRRDISALRMSLTAVSK